MEREYALVLGTDPGLCQAIVHQCLARGWPTIGPILATSPTGFVALVGKLSHPADVSEVRNAIDQHLHRHQGRIARTFWVTGTRQASSFEEQDLDQAQQVLREQFLGPIALLQAAWGDMLEATGPSHLAAVASTRRSRADEAVSCAAEHAQTGFVKSLAQEARRHRLADRRPKIRVSLFFAEAAPLSFPHARPANDTGAFRNPCLMAERLFFRMNQQTRAYGTGRLHG
jgi:NAD(P)-dependent dehydrogenase (short-subunit alcohol dehydrogenase family)